MQVPEVLGHNGPAGPRNTGPGAREANQREHAAQNHDWSVRYIREGVTTSICSVDRSKCVLGATGGSSEAWSFPSVQVPWS